MREKSMNSKGQISALDVLAAAFLFILVFVSMRGIWLGNLEAGEKNQAYLDMKVKAMQAVDSLLKTKGFPSNWNKANVELIGLAKKPNVLSERKLQEFRALAYNTAKEKLWLQNYDFRFELHAKNSADDLNVGMPIDNNSTIVSLKRTVKYKGAEASVFFKVFTE